MKSNVAKIDLNTFMLPLNLKNPDPHLGPKPGPGFDPDRQKTRIWIEHTGKNPLKTNTYLQFKNFTGTNKKSRSRA